MTRGAVLIVKNEAATIERCLASARAAGVTRFTVVDTGSTDGTLGVGGVANPNVDVSLWGREWVNFGHNRSEAFALARGTADWLLALDADMTVEWDEGWEPDPDVSAYMLEMGSGAFSYRLPLLLRGDLPWKSVGSVHEFTVLEDGSLGRREPTDHVRIIHHGEGRGSPEKSRWHLDLLTKSWEEEQTPRAAFYLGQTERELGNTDRARDWYRLRSMMGGWEEEGFYAAYQASLLEPEWPQRSVGLMAAWEMRPARLEPLHALVVELNQRDMHHAAYGLSGVQTGPCADILFVDRSVWDWGMAFQRSIASWWVGDRDEFARLTGQLLLTPRLPDHVRAQVMANHALRAA